MGREKDEMIEREVEKIKKKKQKKSQKKDEVIVEKSKEDEPL